MNKFLLLGISLLLGYSQEWSAFYIKFFQKKNIHIHGTIESFRAPCNKRNGNSVCTDRYTIPLSIISGAEALSTGVILSASTYYCSDTPSNAIGFDDISSPGRRFDLMSTYQTISLKQLTCSKELIIEAWSKNGAIRSGYQKGVLATGSNYAINRLKNISEFFTKEFLRIISLLIAFAFFLNFVIEKVYAKKKKNTEEVILYLLWMSFFIVSSDLLETILPFSKSPVFTNKLVAFFSIMAHYYFPWSELTNIKKINQLTRHKIDFTICIISIIFLTSSYWREYFYFFHIVNVLNSLIVTFLSRKMFLAIFTFLYSLALLKALNISFMPTSLITGIFVATFLIQKLLNKIIFLSNISRTVFSIQKIKDFDEANSTLEGLEKMMFEIVDCKRMTFLHLNESNGCQIRIYSENNERKISTEVIDTETLPPAFAFVISSQESLWHIDQNSEVMSNINSKRKQKYKYDGNLLSVLPLSINDTQIGAFAFTNYTTDLDRDKDRSEQTKLFFDIISPIYCEKILARRILQRNLDYTSVSTLKQSIDSIPLNSSKLNSQENMKRTIGQLQSLICNSLDAYGYIGEVNKSDSRFKIWNVQGYVSEVQERIANGKIYTHESNKHGPLPLAIHEKRIIIIPDVNLYKDVYHTFTNYFFEKCGTHSCTAIPIYNKNTGEIWGAIVLERNSDRRFTGEDKNSLQQVSILASDFITKLINMGLMQKTQNALKEFIPEQGFDKFISDGTYEEKDTGFLMMIDMKASTKINNQLGREIWEKAMKELTHEIRALISKLEIELQEINWDCFILSISSQNCTPGKFQEFQILVENLKEISTKIYLNYFSSIQDLQHESVPKFRACAVFGDITRGIEDSEKKFWKIKGQEIANVVKLEDTCKTLQKNNPYTYFFIDESIHNNLALAGWINAETIVESNQRKIFYSNTLWDSKKKFKLAS